MSKRRRQTTTIRCVTFAIVTLLTAQIQAAPADPPACRLAFPPTQTAFCISVTVKAGYVTVVPATANFRPAGDFSPNPLDPAKKQQLQRGLVVYSDHILRQNRLYSYAFLEKPAMPPTTGGAIAVTPPTTIVPADGSVRHFTASERVKWSISPNVGSISDAGVYTAPARATDRQTITVTATSAKDGTRTATAKITVIPIPPEVLGLNSDTLPEAIKKLKEWPDCQDCDHLLDTMAANLPDRASDTPFVSVRTGDPNSESFFAFRVDRLFTKTTVAPNTQPVSVCQDLGVLIRFDFGTKAYADEDGRLLHGGQVCDWVRAHYEDRFWIAGEIKTHFDTLYSDLGLTPTVFVSQAGESRAIHLAEAYRIGRIIFPADKSDPNTSKLAYLLLNTPDFERFRDVSLHSLDPSSPIQGFILCLPELVGPNQHCDDRFLPVGDEQQSKLAYLDDLQFQQRQAEVQAVGYSLAPPINEPSLDDSGPNARFRVPAKDLLIQSVASSAGSTPSAGPASKPPAATGRTDLAKRASAGHEGHSVEAAKPGVSTEPSLARPKISSVDPANVPAALLSNTEYGFRVQYRPGQSVRVSALLQGANFHLGSSKGFLSGEVGGDGAHATGSGNVNLDYLWFAALRRRLSFQVTGSSDATAQRLLGGVMVDERRTGGNAYSEFDVFRNIGGFLFRLTAEPRHEMVVLSPASGNQAKFYLTTIEPGALLQYSTTAALHPVVFQLAPRIKLGLGFAAAEPAYQVFTLDGGLHQRLSNDGLISLDLSGRFQQASDATPIFELPSLGGGDSLRGFRTDDALGRTLWSLQTEIWAPVPGSLHARPDQPVWSFLRQQIRLAADFDAGGVENTGLENTPAANSLLAHPPAPGWRWGPGIGIRFLRGTLALKLDWGYGFGDGALGRGHGRFYVGVSRIAAF
ncbi:MAG TPA: BamA/TamA family outer membrane protein [Bryobacteraceae bacterium]|nr:BamA/TamA family outer membrane protein [Bryobacteraceae bacterium]